MSLKNKGLTNIHLRSGHYLSPDGVGWGEEERGEGGAEDFDCASIKKFPDPSKSSLQDVINCLYSFGSVVF